MNHRHAVGTGGCRRFGSTYGGDGVIVIEGLKLRVQLLPPNLPQDLPGDAKMAVVADGGVLLIELLSDASSFGVDLVVEGDGLVGRAINSFARDPANHIGKFRWIGLVARVFQFSIERLVGGFVTDVAQLSFEDGDLRVTWISRSEYVTLITYWDGLLWKIRNEVGTKAGRDAALRGFRNCGAKNLFPLGAGRRLRCTQQSCISSCTEQKA